MLFAVMAEMATLTERLQITGPIVAGVMIKMRRRQHDLHLLERCIVGSIGIKVRGVPQDWACLRFQASAGRLISLGCLSKCPT